jgi:hypothetical protein
MIPEEEWEARIAANEESDRVFWEGAIVPAKCFVELPFWLMTADARFTLTYRGCEAVLCTHSDYSEVVSGATFLDSRRNLIHFGTSSRIGGAEAVQKERCPVSRPQKTVVEIDILALAAAFSEFAGVETRSVNRANQYFTSLAVAHLPFINLLIAAYRSASRDPFAFAISEWDVPVWWFSLGEQLVRTDVMPYWNSDSYPVIGEFDTRAKIPYVAASTNDVRTAITHPFSPGRIELLDALSLMYRGRYEDAVRSAVTAIEIVVEEKLASCLRKLGLNEFEVEQRLEASRDNFHRRIDDYEETSRRRLPGPIVSRFPHLNGLRLKQELESVRTLRHKIVHQGTRIDSRGQALRAVETMTWLYDWFTEDEEVPMANRRNYEVYSVMRGFTTFPWEYTSDGVSVCNNAPSKMPEGDEVRSADEITGQVFASLVEPPTCDLELFVRMAFASLDASLEDAPTELKGDSLRRERYRMVRGGIKHLIFCLSLDGVPSLGLLEEVAATCSATAQEDSEPCRAIAVVHHEQQLPAIRRKLQESISSEVVAAAQSQGIAIVTSIDLRKLIFGIADGLWTKETALRLLAVPGRPTIVPPGFRKVGTVRKFYDRTRVVSVQLDDGARIRVGEAISFETAYPVVHEPITSMQINRCSVGEAIGPATIGVLTSLPRKAFAVGQIVYASDSSNAEVTTAS